MDIPDLLYLNRFGLELPEKFQSQWSDIYKRATDEDGNQHITCNYDYHTKLYILKVKMGNRFEYFPADIMQAWNYKPLTIYTYTAGPDDARRVYSRFNQYIKEHRSKIGITIERDRKLAADATQFAKFKTFDKWAPKLDKPAPREYWFQYWGGYFEGYESTDKIF